MDNMIQELYKQIAFLERENKEFGKSVIFHMNSDVNRQKAAKMVHWLKELAAYQDKTYISEDFLTHNGFEKREYDYLYCDDVEEISAQCIDAEIGVWRVEVGFLESGNGDTLNICTVGQLRMFLAIEGLGELAKQFK